MRIIRVASCAGIFLITLGLQLARAQAQNYHPPLSTMLRCSPAPCVLPPARASEGGDLVNSPSIVADPLHPASLLMGSTDFNCQYAVAVFSSKDGSTWDRTCLTQPIGTYQPGGTPLVAFNSRGTAYTASGYVHRGYNTGLMAIQSSTDGIHWSLPVKALKEGMFPFDPSLAVDTSPASPSLGNIYISAVINTGTDYRMYVSHSNDGGTTWYPVAVVPAQLPPKVDQNTNLAVGKDGTVYLTWMYCNTGPYACNNDLGYMVFSKSADGGSTWSQPTLMATVVLNQGGLPNTTVGVTNIPVVGVDNSNGPSTGNLYVVMYSWTGTYLQVQVVRSTDGGTTWSKPVPVAPPSDTHDQFFPWLSVSPTGLVGVSWLDRRNDPANIDYQAYAAISSDGGQSFQPNVQLTTAFSNPDVNGYSENDWMGNYTGNTWDGPNYFIAAWMDSSTNNYDMQDVVGGIRLK